MNFKNIDPNKLLEKKSSNHHYIPKFLIEGFTDSNGFLYIYDKQKNIVQKKPRHSSSIFWEKDRNTVEIKPAQETSFLEEEYYSKVDNQASKIIKHFQTDELKRIDFKNEDIAYFFFFLINLFWRIPYTDFAASNVLKYSEIISSGISSDILKNDPTFCKLQRATLTAHTIEEMIEFGSIANKNVNIHQPENLFIIGDNPLLFRQTPATFKELGELDFLIALSSRRIFSSTNIKFENFSVSNAFLYNIAVINQSVRYVACNNLEMLTYLITRYHKFREKGITSLITAFVFDGNLDNNLLSDYR